LRARGGPVAPRSKISEDPFFLKKGSSIAFSEAAITLAASMGATPEVVVDDSHVTLAYLRNLYRASLYLHHTGSLKSFTAKDKQFSFVRFDRPTIVLAPCLNLIPYISEDSNVFFISPVLSSTDAQRWEAVMRLLDKFMNKKIKIEREIEEVKSKLDETEISINVSKKSAKKKEEKKPPKPNHADTLIRLVESLHGLGKWGATKAPLTSTYRSPELEDWLKSLSLAPGASVAVAAVDVEYYLADSIQDRLAEIIYNCAKPSAIYFYSVYHTFSPSRNHYDILDGEARVSRKKGGVVDMLSRGNEDHYIHRDLQTPFYAKSVRYFGQADSVRRGVAPTTARRPDNSSRMPSGTPPHRDTRVFRREAFYDESADEESSYLDCDSDDDIRQASDMIRLPLKISVELASRGVRVPQMDRKKIKITRRARQNYVPVDTGHRLNTTLSSLDGDQSYDEHGDPYSAFQPGYAEGGEEEDSSDDEAPHHQPDKPIISIIRRYRQAVALPTVQHLDVPHCYVLAETCYLVSSKENAYREKPALFDQIVSCRLYPVRMRSRIVDETDMIDGLRSPRFSRYCDVVHGLYREKNIPEDFTKPDIRENDYEYKTFYVTKMQSATIRAYQKKVIHVDMQRGVKFNRVIAEIQDLLWDRRLTNALVFELTLLHAVATKEQETIRQGLPNFTNSFISLKRMWGTRKTWWPFIWKVLITLL